MTSPILTAGTSLQQPSQPLTGKGAHTAAPNILPSALNSMGAAAPLGGSVTPGTRSV